MRPTAPDNGNTFAKQSDCFAKQSNFQNCLEKHPFREVQTPMELFNRLWKSPVSFLQSPFHRS